MTTLSDQFEGAMMNIYLEAKEIGYNASYFVQMLSDKGGVATAKQLINSEAPADGFIALWERGRLDLTVEALVSGSPGFRSLFTRDEILRARQRLDLYKP